MGLYDTIYCEYPLPAGYEDMQAHDFQTKSLDPIMATYTIRADGTLWETKYHRKWVEDSNHRLGGYLRVTGKTVVQSLYHGDIFFYDFRDSQSPLITFRARFTDGQLTSLILWKIDG